MTVSSCTTINALRQFLQLCERAIQKSRSDVRRRARFVVRWRAASCCRSARFSKTNSRWPRSANVSARTTTKSNSNMRRSWPASVRKSTGRVLASLTVAALAKGVLIAVETDWTQSTVGLVEGARLEIEAADGHQAIPTPFNAHAISDFTFQVPHSVCARKSRCFSGL